MKAYHLLITILFFASCNRTSQDSIPLNNNIQIINVNERDFITDGKLSDVITIDSIVFLEYSDKSLIGTINKVIVTNHYIYIIDNEMVKGIYCFDYKGNFINSYKKTGRGPQEYLEIADVSLYQDSLYVFAEPNLFFVLDKNLNFVKEIEINWTDDIPLAGSDLYFSVIDGKTILFYHRSASYHYHLYNLDKEAFVLSYIKRRGTFDISDSRGLTKNSSGKIYLSQNYNDTIYSVDENLITPEYFVNFEKPMTNKEIEERLKLTVYNSFKYPKPQKMYHVKGFICNQEYISFEFIFKRDRYFYYFNKETKIAKIINNSVKNDLLQGVRLHNAIGHYQNSIITWVDAADLVENKGKLSFSIPNNLTFDSNPALIFYKPKFE